MKITQFDDRYTQKLGAGETTLGTGTSGGSNSAFGGDVVGSAGALSVVGLRRTVSLSSNIAPSAAIGNVLTLVSIGGTPVAQFAVASNSGGASAGSNSTRVSKNSSAGVAATYSPSDHIHDGIGTLTSSSSNTLGRGTFNVRQGNNVDLGWTDTDGDGLLDTLTINARASTSSGGGGGGSGDTSGEIGAGFDGGASNLVAGKTQDVVAPFTGTITGWTLLGDASGSTTIGISKSTYAGFPGSLTSITAAAPPTMSSAQKATSSTLTGWTTAVTAADVLRFTLSSVSGLRQLVVVLTYSRP